MRAPQHVWRVSGGAGGWVCCECGRCGRLEVPSVFGWLWSSWARWLPFCERWRCTSGRGEELTPETHPALFEALASWDHANAEPFVLPDMRDRPLDLALYPYQQALYDRVTGPDGAREVFIAKARKHT